MLLRKYQSLVFRASRFPEPWILHPNCAESSSKFYVETEYFMATSTIAARLQKVGKTKVSGYIISVIFQIQL